jgi:ribosomal protein S18 acetylase RimI-like enzyme
MAFTQKSYRIIVDDEPLASDIERVRQGLVDHNVEQGRMNEGERLAAYLCDRKQRIWGGIVAWIWGTCVEIHYLWVYSTLRGQGYGRALLHALEEEATARGCTVAVLDTYSFQAPGFYQKADYEVFGVIEGFPRGVNKYFMRKRLE